MSAKKEIPDGTKWIVRWNGFDNPDCYLDKHGEWPNQQSDAVRYPTLGCARGARKKAIKLDLYEEKYFRDDIVVVRLKPRMPELSEELNKLRTTLYTANAEHEKQYDAMAEKYKRLWLILDEALRTSIDGHSLSCADGDPNVCTCWISAAREALK